MATTKLEHAPLTRPPAPKPKIRVAHLIHTMAHGGVETALLNWLRALDKDQFEPHLVCFANPGESERPFVDAAAKENLTVHRIPWGRSKPVFRAARQMAAYVREHRIDVLHCHNTYADITGAITARLTPVKTLTTLYVWGDFGWKRNALQWLDWMAIKALDRVTAHCEETRVATVAKGMREEDVDLLTCGFESRVATFDPAERNRRRAELGASAQDTVLINVARFWGEKAHDVQLQGLRHILKQKPHTKLWLLGVGPMLDEIRALSHQMGLDDHVNFLGFRDDLPEILALADLQIHPSDMEGVPLAVLSGMMAGLPIVASCVGGLPEIIKHEKTGILIQPRQPEALARAVIELMDSPELQLRLGKGAQAFIRDEYSLQAAAARVGQVYEKMLAQAG